MKYVHRDCIVPVGFFIRNAVDLFVVFRYNIFRLIGICKAKGKRFVMSSKIETMILDSTFDYLQPYFYNNPYALRCELGIGDTNEVYMKQARKRALEIYRILFPNKADAIVFNQWIYDWSDSGSAEKEEYGDNASEMIESQLSNETRALRFLLENMMNYRHVSVKGLKTYDDPAEDAVRRNRIVCYADNIGFDDLALIEKQIADENNSEVSLVSFENECILSVYDDRGCDIVFSTYEKMREFYHLLEPFFLKYDYETMKKRFEQEN